MQLIVATNEMVKRGWSKRPLIVVPNGVYNQWIGEIQDIIPDVKINALANLGGDFKGDLASLEIEDGSISLITYEGMEKLGFQDETYASLTADLQDFCKTPTKRKPSAAKKAERPRWKKQSARANEAQPPPNSLKIWACVNPIIF